MINFDQIKSLVQRKDWAAVYGMLDNAATADDMKNEVRWRAVALEKEERFDEALTLLQENVDVFNSRSLFQHELARLLLKINRGQEALIELSKAPCEAEMASHYGLAIDAKFFYLYLLAKKGDPSVKDRLSEIPDDYEHITMDGKLLAKSDIAALL